jgi:hypothetical protein
VPPQTPTNQQYNLRITPSGSEKQRHVSPLDDSRKSEWKDQEEGRRRKVKRKRKEMDEEDRWRR